ncbi:MAG: FkbM family methyltransferase [Burkholderiales bacterium]|nr:FkbM family methyltransferase [Burkholderiales bacterium]
MGNLKKLKQALTDRESGWPRIADYLRRRGGIYYRKSWSQCGEDLILRYLFDLLQIARPGYIDIGAHHPWHYNNTYLFYRQGARGVNIEPDPLLHAGLRRGRRRDVNLNMGIGPHEAELDFYVMSARTLNTFSAGEARKCVEEHGLSIVETRRIKVQTFAHTVDTHMGRTPDLVSLDVEGMDLDVLRSIDFSRYRPHVFCVETISYAQGDGSGIKSTDIHALMLENGYRLYADTYINSIYVAESSWRTLLAKR